MCGQALVIMPVFHDLQMVPPKVADFKSLCIPDDQTERPEPPPPNLTNWDDVF